MGILIALSLVLITNIDIVQKFRTCIKMHDIDREKLINLAFADDVALTISTIEDMKVQLNILNEEQERMTKST